MGIKLIIMAVAFAGGLWLMGYGPDDFARAAHRLSEANASAIAPDGNDDWG